MEKAEERKLELLIMGHSETELLEIAEEAFEAVAFVGGFRV